VNPEVKTKWVAALRSGQYKQRTGYLRGPLAADNDEQGHCCLGVLCEIQGVKRAEDRLGYGYTSGLNSFDSLPGDDVLEAVGLSNSDANRLAHKNDTGSTFSEIADYIEANL
jgi:hypothetical protein